MNSRQSYFPKSLPAFTGCMLVMLVFSFSLHGQENDKEVLKKLHVREIRVYRKDSAGVEKELVAVEKINSKGLEYLRVELKKRDRLMDTTSREEKIYDELDRCISDNVLRPVFPLSTTRKWIDSVTVKARTNFNGTIDEYTFHYTDHIRKHRQTSSARSDERKLYKTISRTNVRMIHWRKYKQARHLSILDRWHYEKAIMYLDTAGRKVKEVYWKVHPRNFRSDGIRMSRKHTQESEGGIFETVYKYDKEGLLEYSVWTHKGKHVHNSHTSTNYYEYITD